MTGGNWTIREDGSPFIEEAAPPKKCDYCERFFSRFRCNKPLECDCPKCQGYCECSDPVNEEDDDD